MTLQDGEHAVVNVVLPPASHKVEVRSVPEGATVYLDQRVAVGETPTTIEVTDDEFHELRVEKTGYEVATRALTPDDHDPILSLALAPERQPRGTLLVDANTAAEVYIDGIDTGYTTPTLGIHEPLGEHVVEVRDGAGHKASSKVNLTPGADHPAAPVAVGWQVSGGSALVRRRRARRLLMRRLPRPSRSRCAWRPSRPTAPSGRARSRPTRNEIEMRVATASCA